MNSCSGVVIPTYNKENNSIGGVLYWIMGLPGSGKTAIGTSLYYKLREDYKNVVLLDDDIMRTIITDVPSCSEEDGKDLAMKYARMCKMLTDQGMIVICCAAAVFDEIRDWNRKNNRAYVEVFLDVSWEILKKRDQKRLYAGYEREDICRLIGLDIEAGFLNSPDIVITNDGSISVEKCVSRILAYNVRYLKEFDRDVEYWNLYYASKPDINKPSLFAEYALEKMDKGKNIIELGCGNGRDSIYFAQNGMNVIGIDASDKAIRDLKNYYEGTEGLNIQFFCDDFVCSSTLFQSSYDYCYSRFTLHAITAEQEIVMLKNVYNALNIGGLFFVEVRSIHDEIYGKGEEVARNSYIYNGHFRRFIVLDELVENLEKEGFVIEYARESRGFAPYGDSDPEIIRVIARRR